MLSNFAGISHDPGICEARAMNIIDKIMIVFSCAFIAFCWGIYPFIANTLGGVFVPPMTTLCIIAMITSSRLDKERDAP
jgi:hypothetical protein